MTGTDRTDDWERIARQTLWQSLTALSDEAARTTDEVADAVYWGHDLDREQVERLRQTAFDLRFAAEEYLARLCADAEPWADADDECTPSFHPGALPPSSLRGSEESTTDALPEAERSTADEVSAVDPTTDDPGG